MAVFVGIANLIRERMEVLEATYKLGSMRLKGVIFMINFSEVIPVSCKRLNPCNKTLPEGFILIENWGTVLEQTEPVQKRHCCLRKVEGKWVKGMKCFPCKEK